MPWKLEIVDGPDIGKQAELNSAMIIGRDPAKSNILLTDQSASRSHARLRINKDQTLLLEDLNSTQGTFLNGQQVFIPTAVGPGDLIQIGANKLRILETQQSEAQSISSSKAALITIGRDPANQLVIAEPQVSRRHASIERHADHQFFILDHNSSSGTLLNRERISGRAALQPGAEIIIGSKKYTFDGLGLINAEGNYAACFTEKAGASEGVFQLPAFAKLPLAKTEMVKWFFGSILAAIPLLEIFASGYRFRLFQLGQAGSLQLPEWERWGDLAGKGLQFFLIRISYYLAPVLFTLILYRPTINIHSFTGLHFFTLFGISIILFLLAAFFLPVGLAHFADSGRFLSAFQFKVIFQVIRNLGAVYFQTQLLILAAWLLVALFSLIPYIGLLLAVFGAFYIHIIASLYFGFLYNKSMEM